MGRRLALLIATYQYQDTGLRRLTAPAHDAESLAAVLQDPDIAGFEVTTLINEPHHRVGEAIGDFYRDRRRDDLTLLYFTGHGLKDDNGRLYLAMANTRRDSLLFTALSAEQIDQAMSGCPSRRQVLILDCCYSGAFPAGHIAKAGTEVHALESFQGRGRTVLTASDATQYSFEGNQLHGEAAQSVFTRYLVAGLRDGSADLDGDGDITLDELYSYVYSRVVEEMPQQRPKKQDNVEGRTIIARNINWSLPVYLHNALHSPIATDRLGALDGLDHLYRIGNDTVRACVRDEIQRLTNDDSRAVSSAAVARLRSILPQPPAQPTRRVDLSKPKPEKALEPPAQHTPPHSYGSSPQQYIPPPQHYEPPPQQHVQAPKLDQQQHGHADPARQPYIHPGSEPVAKQQTKSAPPSRGSSFGAPNIDQLPGPLADFGTRVISFLIDFVAPCIIIIGVPVLVFSIIGPPPTTSMAEWLAAVMGISFDAFAIYAIWNSCYRQGVTGQSIGRRVTRTKLVKIGTGKPVGFRIAMLRPFCHSLSLLAIGFLWPLWDQRRQTVTDKIFGTVVVRIDAPTP